jgi:hypothetical protein
MPTEEGKSKSDRYLDWLKNRPAVAVLIVVATVIIALGTFTDAGIKLINAVGSLLPTAIPPDPAIESVRIGEDTDYFILQTTVFNPLARDVLVTKTSIGQEITSSTDRCISSLNSYKVEDTILVADAGDNTLKFSTGVSDENDALKGFTFPVGGTYKSGCDSENMELYFDTSLVLAANGYTSFLMKIPKHLKILDSSPSLSASASGQTSSSDALPTQLDLNLYAPTSSDLYHFLGVTLQTNATAPIEYSAKQCPTTAIPGLSSSRCDNN